MNKLISNLIGVATVISGIALLGYLIYGAIMWITAQGNEERVEQAQKTISNALIGLVIVVVATIIASIISAITGIDILNAPWEDLGPA